MSGSSARRRVYELFAPRQGGRAGRFVDWFILTLIAINVLAVMLETVDPLLERYAALFDIIEVISVAIFTVEYLARVWSVVEEEAYRRPIVGRLRYASRFMLVIDLLAILPFYLAAFGLGVDLRFLRALRLLRLFRLIKLARYSQALDRFVQVLRERQEKLVIAFSANFLLLLISSSVMYTIEHQAQPEVFPSIPETMWWGVITLTTVGYGDVVPVTPLGQVVGALVAVLGIGMFALPAALIATGFAAAAGVEDTPEVPDAGPDDGAP
jgi:voltage-gated potassium channel